MNVKLLTALAALLVAAADGYHILCIFNIPSRSHNILGQGVVRALLKGGHEVTWVTPYPPKDTQKGLHIIDGSITRPIIEALDITSMRDKRNNNSNNGQSFAFIRAFTANISLATASIPALKQAMVEGAFDAVVTETFFSEVDGGYAAVLQVPWIVLSGTPLQPMTEALVDEVRSVPILPLIFNDFGVPMSFFERATNVGLHIMMRLSSLWYRSETEQQYESMFQPLATARNVRLPPLRDVSNNVSILLVNSHPSYAHAQSMPPNVVEIGGYHIEETIQPLPEDLQDLMDYSSRGVVYFSMGSVLKSSALPEATKQALLKTLGELPYTVLWKFEEELKDLPKNVHIRAWMPQAAILAHKNTKVFITHGGLLSNLETLKYGVPLIAIPVFGDQPTNAARAVRAGYAVRVTYDSETMADGLRDALKEVLESDEYNTRAKYLSSLFNKRAVSPTKLIQHYVEVAVSTKGAYHLRSKALLYAWYQRWMLDLLAALLLALYVAYRILKKAVRAIASKVTSRGNNKKNKPKNN